LQSGGAPESVVINVRGFFKELDFDTWKPAEKATLKCSVACTYYKLAVGESELIEIDPINMIGNVNGADLLAALKSEAAGFYRLIAQANPSQQKFINGWLQRAYDIV
jgi:P2 family phage contractile tail tube protein